MKTIPGIDRLSDKLVTKILQFLDIPSLCNASQVHQVFNILSVSTLTSQLFSMLSNNECLLYLDMLSLYSVKQIMVIS